MTTTTKSPSEFQKAKAVMTQDLEDADPHGQHGEVPQLGKPATEVADPVKDARKFLMKAANLYNLCVKCADKVISPNVPPIAQNEHMFQAAVGTLFIEAARSGFVRIMPDKPIANDGSQPAN